MSERPLIRVGVAVIVRGNCVLIDRRATGPLADWWEFPGGKLHGDESVADCIRRECREELGIEVEVVEHLRTLPHEYPHGRVELNFHICRIVSGEPRPLEVAEVAWVRPEQTADYQFLAANTPIIEELSRRLAGE